MEKQVVIFDTEFTTWEGAMEGGWNNPSQHREVFQLAAIRLEKGKKWQNAATFECLLRPVLNPQLSEKAERLTGVTQQQLEERGLPTAQALEQFGGFMGQAAVVSNGQDINVLAETCGLQRLVMPFGPERFNSLRPQLYAALEAEVGPFRRADYPSGRVYELLGLKLETSQVHNALHDVCSLAATVQALEERGHSILPW